MPRGVSIRMLGSFEAELDGTALDLGGPKQRAVLALMLAAHGHVVSVDRIIDALWHGEPPPKAIGALQAYVSKLRGLLEPDRAPRAPAQILISSAPGYAVRLPPDAVDAWRFEQLLRAAEADPARRLALLREALGLWRGQALAEFALAPWAEAEAARLEELRFHAREQLVDAALRCGATTDAVVAAEALVRDAPLREEAWRLLALAQYAGARQADALATLRRARQTLADELGIDPGPALQDLERDVLTQQVAVPAVLATEPAKPESAPVPDVMATPELPTAPARSEFVGRDDEVRRLIAAAKRARPGRVSVALVSGDPGVGKSALLRRVTDELRERGWRVAVGRCPEVEGAPPAWAWSEALRALAEQAPLGDFAESLTPLLRDDAPPPSGNADVARFHLQRAAAGWLSSLTAKPLVIVLDDVHRADAETRKMLARLVQTPNESRLCFLLAHRNERSDDLTEVLAIVAPQEPERVRLEGLDRAAANEMIASITGSEPSPSVLWTLLKRTEGNPFYLKESARLLASVGVEAAMHTVPTGVADVLQWRLARLPGTARDVLRFAAVIGRTVDVNVLVHASTLPDDAVYDGLEAAELAGLIAEAGPGTIRFTHVLIRDALYESISAVRRPAAHAAVAAALEEVTPSDVAALAHHLAHAANRASAVRAARYSLAAGEQAESRLAYERAVELYRQALACLDIAPPDPQLRLEVLLRLVPALVRSGDILSIVGARREAVALAEQIGAEHLLAQAVSCSNVPSSWINRPYGRFDTAFVALVKRLLATATLTEHERCMVLNTYVRETSFRDDPTSGQAADQALELARGTGDPELIALSLISASEIYLADLDPKERDAIRLELRAVAEEHGLVSYELLADIFDAQSAATRADLIEYRQATDDALALAGKLGLGQAIMVSGYLDAGFACMVGDHERAESMYRDLCEAYRPAAGALADDFLVGALFALRQAQGRLPEFIDTMRERYEHSTLDWTPVLAQCVATAGRLDEARDLLAAMPPLRRNWHWMARTTCAARTAILIGDAERAAALYPELVPFRDEIISAVVGCPYRPVAHVLGELALFLGAAEDAGAHLEVALELAQRCGNQGWVAEIQADLSRV